MQTYVVFVKNKKTGEEFTVPHNAPENSHSTAMAEVAVTYPAAKFQVHTAYTLKELTDVMDGVQRWPGVASKPQKGVQPRRVTTTAIPQAHASIFATKGSMVSAPAKKAQPAPVVPAKATQAAVVAAKETAAQSAQQSGQSVISLLKAMREAQ